MEMNVKEELFSEDYETLKHTALRSLTLTLGLSPMPNGREGYVASPYRATPKFAPLKLRKLLSEHKIRLRRAEVINYE